MVFIHLEPAVFAKTDKVDETGVQKGKEFFGVHAGMSGGVREERWRVVAIKAFAVLIYRIQVPFPYQRKCLMQHRLPDHRLIGIFADLSLFQILSQCVLHCEAILYRF